MTSAAPQGDFRSRVYEAALERDSRLVIGLDPDVRRFPFRLRKLALDGGSHLERAIVEFNRTIIEATSDIAVAYKPQSAYFEQYGVSGLKALVGTMRCLRERGLLCILDAKRNDIASTAEAYANAWLASETPFGTSNEQQADALTITPYLGSDSVQPFLAVNSTCVLFLVAKSSNASSVEIQDLELKYGGTVYERVAALASEWATEEGDREQYSRLGLVVGTTQPDAVGRLRALAPRSLFLMPGLGAQSGSCASVAIASDEDGYGAFGSVSRGISYSYPDNLNSVEWERAVSEAVRASAESFRMRIRAEIRQRG